MKVSELIYQLNTHLKEYGDAEIQFYTTPTRKVNGKRFVLFFKQIIKGETVFGVSPNYPPCCVSFTKTTKRKFKRL